MRCLQVPVLYDKKLQKIVSNESTDIVRMMITEMRVRLHIRSCLLVDLF